jgi:glycogen(starch) synthase
MRSPTSFDEAGRDGAPGELGVVFSGLVDMSLQRDNPLVSVILAAEAGASVPGLALASVLTQSYRNLEVLVVGGAGLDGVSDGRVRWVAGGGGLDRGLEEAAGELVAVIGAGDVWGPGKIDRLVRRMVASGQTTGLVYGWWAWLDGAGAIVDTSPGWRIEGNATDALVWMNFVGGVGGPLFRRAALVEVGGFGSAAGMEGCLGWDVALRVAERYRVAVVPEVLTGHRLPVGELRAYCAGLRGSREAVVEALRVRRPEVSGALLQASANQFAMQMVMLAYWSGDRVEALRWLVRTGVRLPVLAAAYLVKMVVWSRRPGRVPVRMGPGVALPVAGVPVPLLPFDRLSVVARMLRQGVKAVVNLPSTLAHRRVLGRLRREAGGAAGGRVAAYLDSTLSGSEREAVGRELRGMAAAGFAVRVVETEVGVAPAAKDDSSNIGGLVRGMSGRAVDVEADFDFYVGWMPGQVYGLAAAVGEAAGLTEEEVVNRADFRRAMAFTRMAEAWGAEYVYTAGAGDAALFGRVAGTLMNVPYGARAGVEDVQAALAKPEVAPLADGKLRVALLSFEYPPETGFGGIGTYTWYQARALAKLGHEVHVLAGFPERVAWRTSTQDGVTVHRYRPGGAWMLAARVPGQLGWHWTRQRLENMWSMAEGLKLIERGGAFDVIEMPECGAEGALMNRRAHKGRLQTPTVVRFHGPSALIMHFYAPARMDVRLCSWLEMAGIRRATVLTSCSRFLAREVVEKMGVRPGVRTIQNGIDLELFDAEPVADLEAMYGIPKGTVTILFAGRMEERKGIYECPEIVERVLAAHPEVVFLFAGQDLFGYMENVMLPRLRGAQERGSVRYLGKLGLRELRACARAVDIYLLPSLWENAPYACLEAMAAGRAVVVSRQGGMPEMIEDGVNGMLGELGLASSFAERLGVLIEQPALREDMGRAARRTVEERYTDLEVGRLSVEVYREAMRG